MDVYLEEILAEIAPGWTTDGYGFDSMLICPHGNMIEQDGFSGECGCRSPLREAGLI